MVNTQSDNTWILKPEVKFSAWLCSPHCDVIPSGSCSERCIFCCCVHVPLSTLTSRFVFFKVFLRFFLYVWCKGACLTKKKRADTREWQACFCHTLIRTIYFGQIERKQKNVHIIICTIGKSLCRRQDIIFFPRKAVRKSVHFSGDGTVCPYANTFKILKY